MVCGYSGDAAKAAGHEADEQAAAAAAEGDVDASISCSGRDWNDGANCCAPPLSSAPPPHHPSSSHHHRPMKVGGEGGISGVKGWVGAEWWEGETTRVLGNYSLALMKRMKSEEEQGEIILPSLCFSKVTRLPPSPLSCLSVLNACTKSY